MRHRSRRHAGDRSPGRDIIDNHTSGRDQAIRSDFNALNDSGAGADVGPVADNNPAGQHHAGCHMSMRADLAVVIDCRAGIDDTIGSE